MRADPRARPWQPLTALLVVALIAWFVSLRLQTPDPAGADAPATEFSAARALAVLERIAGDQRSHGVGTPANEAVRARIVEELTALGLEAQEQRTFACRSTVCAPVVNIFAEIRGSEPGPAVLIATHYDSVHAGPGVGDDLHGVAISIETARSILAQGTPRRSVMLLIDEGEEVGLLGAQAFIEEHPAAGRIGAVVNIEARGTGGLSAMFQTSENNAALVEPFLDAAPRPRATSLAVEVYRRMPNDTDLTVFLDAGIPGVNFAFIGGVARYHTPIDDLAHLDKGSLQHQGESAHAAAVALAASDLPLRADANLVYADVLGLFVLSWPEAWAGPLAAVVLVGLVGLALVAQRRERVRGPRCAVGFGAALAVLLLVLSTAFGVGLVVAGAQGEALPAYANPGPLRFTLWVTAALVALSVAAGLARWAKPLELAFGVWITWACVAIPVAVYVPGAGLQWTAPMIVALGGLAWAVFQPRREFSGLLLGGAAMAIVWLDLSFGLEDAFGIAATPVIAGPLGIVFSVFAPCLVATGFGWGRIGAALLALIAVGCVWSSVVDVYDADSPRRVAIAHYEDRQTGDAFEVLQSVGHPGEDMLAVADFGNEPRPVGPVFGEVFAAPSVPTDAAPPELDAAGFRSPRGADRAILVFPPNSAQGISVEGRAIAHAPAERTRVYLFGVPRRGVAVRIRGGVPGTEVTVLDCSADLPPTTAKLVRARPATATTFQWGDVSCIKTNVPLPVRD